MERDREWDYIRGILMKGIYRKEKEIKDNKDKRKEMNNIYNKDKRNNKDNKNGKKIKECWEKVVGKEKAGKDGARVVLAWGVLGFLWFTDYNFYGLLNLGYIG